MSQLRTLAETTSTKVNREEEQVTECRTYVQASQRYIQQLQPWIEQGESYVRKRFDQAGASNINDAKQLFDKHKVRKQTIDISSSSFFLFRFPKDFLEERRRMLTTYNNLLDQEHNITDQQELKSSIKSLSARWIELVRISDELTAKSEAQHRAWLAFDSELHSFRDQILSDLEQRMQTFVSTDLNKVFDPSRINAFLVELRVREREKFFDIFLIFFFSHSMRTFVIIQQITIVYLNKSLI